MPDAVQHLNEQLDRLEGKAVSVLLSGGVDSAVLLALISRRSRLVHPLYVRSGLFWEEAELYWLRRFLQALSAASVQPVATLELPVSDLYNAHWSVTGLSVPDLNSEDEAVYLPGRNLLLLSKASIYCALQGISAITLGPLQGNPFPDSTPSFFSSFRKAASQALSCDLEVLTPLSHLSKVQVIQLGKDLPLELTFSCIQPRDNLHCGRCNKCWERQRAFRDAQCKDRTQYLSPSLA
ncbi:MAG: 7-cyano-7-deazaguanine synthase [Acidobacteriota bacterium]